MLMLNTLICMMISVILVLVAVLVGDHAVGRTRSWECIGRFS